MKANNTELKIVLSENCRKDRKSEARVALARKLLVIIHIM
jgi:hypothetical protein